MKFKLYSQTERGWKQNERSHCSSISISSWREARVPMAANGHWDGEGGKRERVGRMN
jgi:hypothetical protein